MSKTQICFSIERLRTAFGMLFIVAAAALRCSQNTQNNTASDAAEADTSSAGDTGAPYPNPTELTV